MTVQDMMGRAKLDEYHKILYLIKFFVNISFIRKISGAIQELRISAIYERETHGEEGHDGPEPYKKLQVILKFSLLILLALNYL